MLAMLKNLAQSITNAELLQRVMKNVFINKRSMNVHNKKNM
tara:strand:- start:228 stop:350 length:123 start_codon:yes stop_codon:yes gene_type:complete